MKQIKWNKYLLEFLSIFIAVISAFALSNWNENRNNSLSERKILTEIINGINLDKKDFQSNISGHELSLKANKVFRDLIANKPIPQESIGIYYTSIFRDYAAIINRSGYESLKEAGLKTIKNDSLRFEIITLYDYYYGIIMVLDGVNEMQSFRNYFAPINSLLHPYMEFDNQGALIMFTEPTDLSEIQRKEILSYLWRLDNNRKYKLNRYKSVLEVMDKVKASIEKYLKQ